MAAPRSTRRTFGNEAGAAAPGQVFSDRRIPHAGPFAILLAVATVSALMYETRSFSFFFDEWDFVIGAPSWTLRSYFMPHSEHWLLIPMVIYKVLLVVFGARNYQPFIATHLVLHAATALVLFRIIRRRSGDVLALASVSMLLLLGRGYENILWAFQISFVGSVFFGLVAIDLIDRPPVPPLAVGLASMALVASLMCSGTGLFMSALVIIDLALDPSRRRLLPALMAAPAIAYATWDVAFGARAAAVYGPPISIAGLLALRSYLPVGIGAAVAGLFGLSLRWQALGFAGLAAVLAARWSRLPSIDSRVLGATGALVTQFGLTGLVRYRIGDLQAASPRYVYIGSVFLLLILTQSFAGVAWTRTREVGLATIAVVAIALGAYQLREAAHVKNELFFRQRAELQTAALFRNAPDLHRDAHIDRGLMPQVEVAAYFDAVDKEGSTVATLPYDRFSTLPTEWADSALGSLFGGAVSVRHPLASTAGCIGVAAGATGIVTDVPPGEGVLIPARPGDSTREGIAAPGPEAYDLYLWDLGTQPAQPATRVVLGPDGGFVRLPDTGRRITWQIRLAVPGGTVGYLCQTAG